MQNNNVITPEIIARYGKVGPIDPELHRMMPQAGVRHSVFPPHVKHNAIWDYHISPNGRHFLSLCAEGSFSQYAHLYEYMPDTGAFELCFKLDDVTVAQHRAIRPSKFHSSFSFLPDGKLIMSSHTTATAPNHPEWLPFAYYDHQWEGFQGSNIYIYDPVTRTAEDLGIPAPRATIYGGVYEPSTNAFYFGCYMRGHVYKLDLANRHVKDYGQATEMASFRYIVGPDQNVYFSTKSGSLQRVNTKTDRIEDLGVQFPVYPHIPESLYHNQLMFAVIGPDGKLYHNAAYGETLLRYDFETNASEIVGRFTPPEFRKYKWGLQVCPGLAFDEKGVLWYIFNGDTICWLTSWDVLNGEEPKNRGVMGTPDRRVGYVSEMYVRDGVLYAADTNHGYDPPGILSAPLESLRKGEPEIRCRDAYQYIRLADGEKQFPGDLAKEGERHYLRELMRNEKTAEFYGANPWVFMTPVHFLTKIWKHAPIEDSAVRRIWYDDGGNVHAVSHAAGEDIQFQYHTTLREGRVISVVKEKYEAPAAAPATMSVSAPTPAPSPAKPPAPSPAKPPANVNTTAFDGMFVGVKLPARPGRQYIATVSAWAPLSGGRFIVGTRDGMLAIIREGKAFSLGACAAHGPVHQIVSKKDGSMAFGVAGDPSDLGTVFTYDDENGLTIYGRVYMNDTKCVAGLGASCEPYCLALSVDERWLAIGARDRMGCVYEYDLTSGIRQVSMYYKELD